MLSDGIQGVLLNTTFAIIGQCYKFSEVDGPILLIQFNSKVWEVKKACKKSNAKKKENRNWSARRFKASMKALPDPLNGSDCYCNGSPSLNYRKEKIKYIRNKK